MSRRVLRPPRGPLDATVVVPGSKSVANRALICAALADGESILRGIPSGDDSAVIVDTLGQCGRVSGWTGDECRIVGSPRLELPGIVDAKLAGTSSRFLTAVAALGTSTTVIDGDGPLRGRPMGELHDALARLGAQVTPLGVVGHLPVSVAGGHLTGGSISLRGDVSSQFISGMMLIGPILRDGLRISLDGPLVSRSYVEMTAAVMESFGANVKITPSGIEVAAGGYTPVDYRIEPDFSSAAFPLCALALRAGRVTVPGLASSVLQGDSAILGILGSMGLDVRVSGDDVLASRAPGSGVVGIDMDMSDCSDLVPAVAVAALAADGVTNLTGIGFIRNKESDRIGDLAAEMVKVGGLVTEMDDGLRIVGPSKLSPAVIDSHHDHRMVMALSLASLSSGELTLEDADAVTKSWPTFFEDMRPILGASEVSH